MSTTTEVDLVNVALVALGESKITALSDATVRAIAANTLYEPIRDALLEDFLWNFAVRRDSLFQPAVKVITDINTPSATVTVTSTAHGFSNADTLMFEDIIGPVELNVERFKIENIAANTFDLVNTDGSAFAAYVSGGTARKLPAFGPLFEFDLPSDFFRIARTAEESDKWKIENGQIVSDDSTIDIVYVAKIIGDAGVLTMSEGFKQALSARLAWKLSFSLTGTQSLSASLKTDYNDTLSKAVFTDTQQESTTTVGGSKYVDGRLRDPVVGAESGWANSV